MHTNRRDRDSYATERKDRHSDRQRHRQQRKETGILTEGDRKTQDRGKTCISTGGTDRYRDRYATEILADRDTDTTERKDRHINRRDKETDVTKSKDRHINKRDRDTDTGIHTYYRRRSAVSRSFPRPLTLFPWQCYRSRAGGGGDGGI